MQYNGGYGYSQEPIMVNVGSISQVTDQLATIKNKLVNINAEYRSKANQYNIVSSSISINTVSSQLDNAVYMSDKTMSKLANYLQSSTQLDQGYNIQIANQSSHFSLNNTSTGLRVTGYFSSMYNAATTLTSKNGLKFDFSGILLKPGMTLKLKGSTIANNAEYLMHRSDFIADLGGRWKWNKSLLSDMCEDGINVFNSNENLTSVARKFSNSEFDGLSTAFKNFTKPTFKGMLNGLKNNFIDELKITKKFDFKDFGNLKLSQKVSKSLGALGTGLTVITNGVDNFYQNGEWQFDGESTEEFLLETGVDIVVDAGTTALAAQIGAAAGSVFVPPIGTVIGAGAGVVMSLAINHKFGEPPMSVVDHTKKFVTDGFDKLQESCGNVMDSIGENLSNASDAISNGLNSAKEKVSDIVSNIFW